MKSKKLQIVLGAVAVVLIAAIVFTTISIINGFSTRTVIKKVTTKGEVITENIDEGFDDFLDGIIGDTSFDDDFWNDMIVDDSEEEPEDGSGDPEAPGEDNMDWIDGDNGSGDDSEDDKVYTSEIQKNGEKVTGTNREIDIQLNNVAYKDFWGLGGNTFPEILSDDAIMLGHDSVMWEFERHKYIQSKMGYTRTIISMDAMITNEEENPSRDDIENNKDYQNYVNGVYSWDNDSMASFWEMMDAFNTAGTKVMLNSGWKAHTRIQKWYSAETRYPQGAAPYDIKSFVKANAYWLVECESRYPGLIVSMCFGNEVSKPVYGWLDDFGTHDDYLQYNLVLYSIMQQAVEYIKETGLKASDGKLYNAKNSEGIKNFKLMGADCSYSSGSEELWELQHALDKAMGEDFLGFATHYYYRQIKVEDGRMTGYDLLYDKFSEWNEKLSQPVFIHEFRAESPDKDWVEGDPERNLQDSFDGNFDWDLTYASYCILAANTGVKSLNNWDSGTGYYPNPNPNAMKLSNFVTGIGQLFCLGENAGDARVSTNYYWTSLFQNYVPMHSDVLMTEWEGDDIRVASFKLADGNYTFVVEVNQSSSLLFGNRNIKFNFNDNSLNGKRLYRYTFTNEHGRGEEVDNDTYNGSDWYLNGAVIQSDGRVTVNGKTASDTVGRGYGVYVYSTKAPVQNVTLDVVTQEVTGSNRTAQFSATSNVPNANIKWEIITSASKKATAPTAEDIANGITTYKQVKEKADRGTLVSNGTNKALYTAGANAQTGDKIAIVAYIDSNNNGKFDRTVDTNYALGVVYYK